MSAIGLYEILKRVPNTGAAEARSAADSVATMGDVATKVALAGLRADVKADLAELKAWLAWRLVGGIVILLAAMSTGFGLIGFLLSA